jgi:hypothetical protein
MTLAIGTQILLEDQGEGWFPLAQANGLRGTVIGVIVRKRHRGPFYLVHLEPPLEIQESGHKTRSGLGLVTYDHLVVAARWLGTDIGAEPRVSVHLLVVPQNQPLPTSPEQCLKFPVVVWANCSIVSESCGTIQT